MDPMGINQQPAAHTLNPIFDLDKVINMAMAPEDLWRFYLNVPM